MAKTDEVIEQSILQSLLATPDGLEVAEIIEQVSSVPGALSPRALRNFLGRLEKEQKVIKRKRWTKGPGAPRYVYYHSEFGPQQIKLFDDTFGVRNHTVETKSDVERKELVGREEQEREARARSVLDKIAENHIEQDRYAKAIIDVAPHLAGENPVDQIVQMARWAVDDLNRLGDLIRDKLRRREVSAAEELANELEVRLAWARRHLQRFWRLDRRAGDRPGILELPSRKDFIDGKRATLDDAAARKRLQERIHGGKVLDVVAVQPNLHTSAAGTDSSVADLFLEHTQGSFIPPDPVSVMTAAAALRTRANGAMHEYQDFDIFPDQLREYKDHAAAVNGLIISPRLRNILSEGDFRYARMASMDLRQYHQDMRIAQKDAKWRPIGDAPLLGLPPRPKLIFRDGRLFPLVHRLKDYRDDGLYGKIVRNEIERFGIVVNTVFSGVVGELVYSSVVKSPEMSWLAPFVFWYLHVNNVKVDRKVVVRAADVYRYPFPDTAVSYLLFLGLAKNLGALPDNSVFSTFRAIRRYSDIAIEDVDLPPTIKEDDKYRLLHEDDLADWQEFIRQQIEEDRSRHRESVLDEDQYHPFIYLCSRVAVSMVYAAPVFAYEQLVSGGLDGAGHFLIPRLEVIVKTHELRREEEALKSMLSWLGAKDGCILDNYHTQSQFNTGDREQGLPILVPDVVYYAHEAATFARDTLSEEVQDEIRARIGELRRWLEKEH